MLDILGQKTDKKLDMKSAMKLDKISTMKSDKKSGKKNRSRLWFPPIFFV